jgi:hypothetical protein
VNEETNSALAGEPTEKFARQDKRTEQDIKGYSNIEIPESDKGKPHLLEAIADYSERQQKEREKPKFQQIVEKYVVTELSKFIGAVISDAPKFVISDDQECRVKLAHLTKKEDREGSYWKAVYDETILGAYPQNIVVITDPLNKTTLFEMELVTFKGEHFNFGPHTFTELISEIAKTPLAYKPRHLHEYLAPLLAAYIEKGQVELKNEIQEEGFFWVDGKIVGSKIEIQPVTPAQAQLAAGVH